MPSMDGKPKRGDQARGHIGGVGSVCSLFLLLSPNRMGVITLVGDCRALLNTRECTPMPSAGDHARASSGRGDLRERGRE